MRNILSDERELGLMVEGEIGEIEGLRSGAINGIAALRRRELESIPRKRLGEFIVFAKPLAGRVGISSCYTTRFTHLLRSTKGSQTMRV